MKIQAKRKDLIAALKTASACVASKTTLVILANALFEAEEGKITITCSDLNQRISTECAAEVSMNGKTTIPAKKMLSVLEALSGDTVLLNSNPENHHTNLECGTSKIKFLGLPPDDYPERTIIPEEKRINFSLETADLKYLIDNTSYAIGANESRKVLTGMLFESSDNEINSVGTDGKRLAVATVGYVVPVENNLQRIIPIEAISFLRTLKNEKAEIAFDQEGKKIEVISGNTKYSSKLIEGAFPNYRQVIPESFQYKAQINSADFLAKLNVISMIAGNDKYIQLTFGQDTLELLSENATDGRGEDSMGISLDILEPLTVTINAVMLAMAVKSCSGETFTICLNDNISPIKFIFSDGSYDVIMPIRKH